MPFEDDEGKQSLLLYFVKYPEPGRVKTRLAKTVGLNEAAQCYRKLAEGNFREITSKPNPKIKVAVVYDPPEACEKTREWLFAADGYLEQKGEGLGERLRSAFQEAFDLGFQQVLALGSDTLGLKMALIEKACRWLENKDIVLGPARDGGYYLIGMKSLYPLLFENISWSSSVVFEETLDRIRMQRLSFSVLDALDDLDEARPIMERDGKDEIFWNG